MREPRFNPTFRVAGGNKVLWCRRADVVDSKANKKLVFANWGFEEAREN